jgi:hypothetical protein
VDVPDALTAVENVLRDLVEETLHAQFGDEWLAESGLSSDRTAALAQRREEERQRREGAHKVEERLIYYSDLSDLDRILKKNWQLFAPCLGDHKTMEIYMNRLIDFRHPDRHGRDLLPFEQQLLFGITGEIRNKITIFSSEKDPSQNYFPRIEYVRDSFGNVAKPGLNTDTGLILHAVDEVIFTCVAWDPKGEPVKWEWNAMYGTSRGSSETGSLKWHVEEPDIADPQIVHIWLISGRAFHRQWTTDDVAAFSYRVLPRAL